MTNHGEEKNWPSAWIVSAGKACVTFPSTPVYLAIASVLRLLFGVKDTKQLRIGSPEEFTTNAVTTNVLESSR